jgi:hypothetical protein
MIPDAGPVAAAFNFGASRSPTGSSPARRPPSKGGVTMHWFNVSAPAFRVGRHRVRLWNLFRRRSTAGRWWGVGLLQIDNRHLLFLGRTQGNPRREVWALSVGFLGRT